MSFKVNWNSLETESLSTWTKDILTNALNSGKSPNILASNIIIKDLNFGKTAPDFEILEIGELDKDRFRGIFKINYFGDFHLTLHTKVQANPLNIYYSNSMSQEINQDYEFITPQFVLSNEQFAIPLDLKLSDIKISGIGTIVFSKSKGLTLVFKNDPLDSIKVSSTFDTVQVLANFLQKQIESQIRDLFRETLPTLIHQLSLKYLSLDNNINELKNKFASNVTVDINNNNSSNNSNSSNNGNTSTLKLLEGEEDLSLIYSTKNLQKNLQYYKSRETMSLNIPKFKYIIQRTHMDKFNKNYPNLLNSLSINNSDLQKYITVSNPTTNNNGIPIDILTNESYKKTDGLLKDISTIQANSYYKYTKDAPIKPKRRVIKFNKKKSTSESSSVNNSTIRESMTTPMTPSTSISSNSTLIESTNTFETPTKQQIPITSLKHPTPRKASKLDEQEFSSNEHNINHQQQLQQEHQQNSQSSRIYQEFLKQTQSPCLLNKTTTTGNNGLGLGNSGYFNFVPQRTLSTSPIRNNKLSLVDYNEKKDQFEELNNKKSINHIDITKINNKLKEQLNLKDSNSLVDKKLDKIGGNGFNNNQQQQKPNLIHQDSLNNYSGLFTVPPPPYYH